MPFLTFHYSLGDNGLNSTYVLMMGTYNIYPFKIAAKWVYLVIVGTLDGEQTE